MRGCPPLDSLRPWPLCLRRRWNLPAVRIHPHTDGRHVDSLGTAESKWARSVTCLDRAQYFTATCNLTIEGTPRFALALSATRDCTVAVLMQVRHTRRAPPMNARRHYQQRHQAHPQSRHCLTLYTLIISSVERDTLNS